MTTTDPRPPIRTEPTEPAAGRRRDPLLGVAGVGFAALLLPVALVPHASLDYDEASPPPSSVIAGFFAQHAALEQYQALMHLLAGALLLVFGAALAAQVRRAEGPTGVGARLVGAGAAGAAAVMVATMLLVSGSLWATGQVDGRTRGWLYDIGWTQHPKALVFLPLVLVPACLALRRARALPAALTWSGLVVAVLCLAGVVASVTATGAGLLFPVFVLVIAWVLATGLVALTRGVGPRRAAR